MEKVEDFCFLHPGGGRGLHFLESMCSVSVYKAFGDFCPWTILEKWLLSPEQARSRLSNSGWKGPASSQWVLGLACALLASVQWG